MNIELLGLVLMFVVTLLLAIPFGKYIAKMYGHEKTFLDVIFDPIEKLFFRISGIDPLKGWNFKNRYADFWFNDFGRDFTHRSFGLFSSLNFRTDRRIFDIDHQIIFDN